MKKIALIAAIVLGSSGGLFGSLGTADAVTTGFTMYVDSVAEAGVGPIETTVNVTSGAATVEVEVQNVPAPGLNGYNVTVSWAPAAGLSLVATGITDLTGLPNQIVKTAGAGTATVSFTNLGDVLCTGNTVSGVGPTNTELFSMAFTGVGPGTNTISISTTLSDIALCDANGATPAAFDPGDVFGIGGSTATPTKTPVNTPTPTRTPCASGCPTEAPPPANYKSVTPTPSPTSAATAAPGAPPAAVATTQGGGAGAGGATPGTGLVGPDTGSGGGGSGGGSGLGLLSMIAALTGLVAAAAGATYYRRRRVGA